MLKILDCCRKVTYFNRSISICKILQSKDKKPKRKVTETVELVTLVDVNDKILGLKTKIESLNLAKKLNLSLERVHDTKYGKMYPAYKMFSTSDLLKEGKKSSTVKILKKLPLNSRISDHDLTIKMQTVKKWLSKNCEIHITILSNNESEATMKSVFDKIEEQMKNDCRILDARHKEGSIKFIIIPIKLASKTEHFKSTDVKKNSTEGG